MPVYIFAKTIRKNTLNINVVPNRIVLGKKNAIAVVDITVGDANSRAGVAGLRVKTTAGKIENLHYIGKNQFRAFLKPPSDKFPQIAVVSVADVAKLDTGDAPQVQIAAVAFAAPLELNGTSEPEVQVVIDIGKNRFGPVISDTSGKFTIPVIVEPGEGWATATAKDTLGNTSHSRINLYLPVVQRLQTYIFPETIITDGEDIGWIYVTSLGPTGAPRATPLTATVKHGCIIKSEVIGTGLTRFAYLAPRIADNSNDTLTLNAPKWKMNATFKIALSSGPPTTIKYIASPSPTPADGNTNTKLQIMAYDASGNPASGHSVAISLGELRLAANEIKPGVYESTLAPRQLAGVLTGKILLQPQAQRCMRPRALKHNKYMWVLDRRGIPCLGELIGIAVDGTTKWRQLITTGDDIKGVIIPTSNEDILLVFTDISGEQYVVIPPENNQDEKLIVMPLIEHPIEVAWRVPVAAELHLTTLEKQTGWAKIRLLSNSIEDLEQRVSLDATGASIQPIGKGLKYIDYTINWSSGQIVDVLATDKQTGISAWLRLE
ncbi:MAG: hypothetical protein JW841_14210 [Deltaproteobacteria bacterium]|nr:hypothetical protein [Deltaproteobacteria bacterium]